MLKYIVNKIMNNIIIENIIFYRKKKSPCPEIWYINTRIIFINQYNFSIVLNTNSTQDEQSKFF